MNESNTNLDMDTIRQELSGLSPETLNYIGFDVEGNMLRRPPIAGTRRGVTRPTTNDRNVMASLINSYGNFVTSAQVGRELNLATKDVSYSMRFLIECEFVSSEGQGPTMAYTATTQEPVFVDTIVTPGRRAGHKPGPSAGAAFIAAVNEQEMLSWWSKKDIVARAISMFPDAQFKDSSFGAIPTKLIQQGQIEAQGNAKKREFRRIVESISGAANPSLPSNTSTVTVNEVSVGESSSIVTEG